MSCERNRHLFFQHLAQTTDGLVRLFGSAGAAEAACEQIFQAGRNAAIEPTVMHSHGADLRARMATTLVFDEMRSVPLQPPTHAGQGLPRKDAQRGYQAIWETIQAVRQQRLLPVIAEQVRQFQLLRALEPRPAQGQPFQRGEIPIGRNGAVPANHIQDGSLLAGDRVVTVQVTEADPEQPATAPRDLAVQVFHAGHQRGYAELATDVLRALYAAPGQVVESRRGGDAFQHLLTIQADGTSLIEQWGTQAEMAIALTTEEAAYLAVERDRVPPSASARSRVRVRPAAAHEGPDHGRRCCALRSTCACDQRPADGPHQVSALSPTGLRATPSGRLLAPFDQEHHRPRGFVASAGPVFLARPLDEPGSRRLRDGREGVIALTHYAQRALLDRCAVEVGVMLDAAAQARPHTTGVFTVHAPHPDDRVDVLWGAEGVEVRERSPLPQQTGRIVLPWAAWDALVAGARAFAVMDHAQRKGYADASGCNGRSTSRSGGDRPCAAATRYGGLWRSPVGLTATDCPCRHTLSQPVWNDAGSGVREQR